MGQLGILLWIGLPLAISFGKSSLIAIPLAFLLVMMLSVYCSRKKILPFNGGMIIWYGIQSFIALFILSNLIGEELKLGKKWPMMSLIILAMMFLGKRMDLEGMVPGRQGLLALWKRITIVFVVAIFLAQVANFRYSGALFIENTVGIPMILKEGARGLVILKQAILESVLLAVLWFPELFALMHSNQMVYGKEVALETKRGKKHKLCKTPCLLHQHLWVLLVFYGSYLMLMAIFPYEVLEKEPLVFLLLGKSAALKVGQPCRIELLTRYTLWIGLFFLLWDGVNMETELIMNKIKQRSGMRITKCGLMGLLVFIMLGCTGCGTEPVKKDFLIVADSTTILNLKEYEKEKNQIPELSHLKILVLKKEDDLKRVVEEVMKHTEISLQTHVVYSEEDVIKKVGQDKKRLTKQLRKSENQDDSTILSMLYGIFGEENQKVPNVRIHDGEIQKIGYVMIKDGKIWE